MLTSIMINQNDAHTSLALTPHGCYLEDWDKHKLKYFILSLFQVHISRTVILTRTFTTLSFNLLRFCSRTKVIVCQNFPFTICSQFLFPDAWLFLTPTAYSNDTGLVNSLQIAKQFQILQLCSVPFSWSVFHQFLQLEKNSFLDSF